MSGTTKHLFPSPSPPLSRLSPTQWPGVSPASTTTLCNVLNDNHDKWHIFFNDSGFHNHTAHRALALWALGADAAVIQGCYEHDSSYQRPAFRSPGAVTHANFNDCLGDERYYAAYLDFFTKEVQRQGIVATTEQYIFSKQANVQPEENSEGKPPRMLGRFLGGILHPMIHAGYGFEFGLPGTAAEGLALAAVQSRSAAARLPASFFDYTTAQVAERLKASDLSDGTTPAKRSASGPHAFDILGRMLKDPLFDNMPEPRSGGIYSATMQKYGDALFKYASEWQFDANDPQEVERKMEELVWTNVIIYGIGGWKGGQEFNADFYHMHLVTSSLFLPSYAAHLSPASLSALFRSYFLLSLAWWVGRGRADLNIQAFFESDPAGLVPDGALPTPSKSTLPSPSSPAAVTPNPWLPIIETSVVHPDDHVSKTQRALAHYGSLYGSRQAGRPDFKDTGLPFADRLDGTLFVRAAGLTAKRMGRVREGEDDDNWDRIGFYAT